MFKTKYRQKFLTTKVDYILGAPIASVISFVIPPHCWSQQWIKANGKFGIIYFKLIDATSATIIVACQTTLAWWATGRITVAVDIAGQLAPLTWWATTSLFWSGRFGAGDCNHFQKIWNDDISHWCILSLDKSLETLQTCMHLSCLQCIEVNLRHITVFKDTIVPKFLQQVH